MHNGNSSNSSGSSDRLPPAGGSGQQSRQQPYSNQQPPSHQNLQHPTVTSLATSWNAAAAGFTGLQPYPPHLFGLNPFGLPPLGPFGLQQPSHPGLAVVPAVPPPPAAAARHLSHNEIAYQMMLSRCMQQTAAGHAGYRHWIPPGAPLAINPYHHHHAHSTGSTTNHSSSNASSGPSTKPSTPSPGGCGFAAYGFPGFFGAGFPGVPAQQYCYPVNPYDHFRYGHVPGHPGFPVVPMVHGGGPPPQVVIPRSYPTEDSKANPLGQQLRISGATSGSKILANFGKPSDYYLHTRPCRRLKSGQIQFFTRVFRTDLVHSSRPIAPISRGYQQNRTANFLIAHYFAQLHAALLKHERDLARPDVYLALFDPAAHPYDNFATYGQRFKTFLERYENSRRTREYYIGLLNVYWALIPEGVRGFRNVLLDILAVELKTKLIESSIDFEMITYRAINARELHETLTTLETPEEQIDYFLTTIRNRKANYDRFIDALTEALQTCSSDKLASLVPQIYQIGALANGLGTYDADLELVVHFEAAPEAPGGSIDYETAVLALEVLQKVLQAKLVPDRANRIVKSGSSRVPAIHLDLEEYFPSIRQEVRELNRHAPFRLEFNKVDITVSSLYGLASARLLKFFTHLEPRFTEVATLLYYWISKNRMIHPEALSSHGFSLMVVFFMQTRSPPILPSVEKLKELATEATVVQVDGVAFCDDVLVVKKEWQEEVNGATSQELVVEFLRFYSNFNFHTHAITPLTGKLTTKACLYSRKLSTRHESFKQTILCIEDPFALDTNLGASFRERYLHRLNLTFIKVLVGGGIHADNCITVLTNPAHFNLVPIQVENQQQQPRGAAAERRNGAGESGGDGGGQLKAWNGWRIGRF